MNSNSLMLGFVLLGLVQNLVQDLHFTKARSTHTRMCKFQAKPEAPLDPRATVAFE